MTITYTLPFGKEDNVKNLIFTILTKEYPLKLIDLMNIIKKRYGKSVTFQAVRKAALELEKEDILVRKDKEFEINKEWVVNAKKQLDILYRDLTKEQIRPRNIDSIKGEISVFTFNSVNEMMKFWEDIIDDWYQRFKKGDPDINAYQGAHLWEALLHPDQERKIMEQLKKKGIKSYSLSTGNTPLDRYTAKFYASIGLKTAFIPSQASFDKSHYIATYGDIIVQANYPPEIVKALDEFFKKNKTIEEMNLKALSDIVNKKISIQLTIIKNLSMAEQINKSIIEQIE